jgi:hypothetical protein
MENFHGTLDCSQLMSVSNYTTEEDPGDEVGALQV